jgi:hypothetical protein
MHQANDEEEMKAYKELPSFKKPLKVRNTGVLNRRTSIDGDQLVAFLLPSVKVYSDDQVMFSARGWAAIAPIRGGTSLTCKRNSRKGK